ncbi:MAG: flagellar motor protein PomA [Beijerinckiaceae bacterium]|nr:flagellar motor protein PomA [Beijerinckiaceae bacterium]
MVPSSRPKFKWSMLVIPATIAGLAAILWWMPPAAPVSALLDPVSFALVAGGTLIVAMLRSGPEAFAYSLAALKQRMEPAAERQDRLAAEFTAMAAIARRSGLVALEFHPVEDPFTERCLAHLVDGADEERLTAILDRELMNLDEANTRAIDAWQGVIDLAPAIGLIGTLIGLVGLLGQLNDPHAIAPALAVALLTTLYGAMISNLIGIPILARLRHRVIADFDHKLLIAEGLKALARGEGPRRMRETLMPLAPTTPTLTLVSNSVS